MTRTHKTTTHSVLEVRRTMQPDKHGCNGDRGSSRAGRRGDGSGSDGQEGETEKSLSTDEGGRAEAGPQPYDERQLRQEGAEGQNSMRAWSTSSGCGLLKDTGEDK